MTYRAYAGIGSRETPEDVLLIMRNLGYVHAKLGWTLRSGGAEGADSAFEQGAFQGMELDVLEPWPEIFLPWEGFNGRPVGPDHLEPLPAAYEIAEQFHPAWDRLTQGGKRLHARNAHQILGPGLDNLSEFVVCWTPGGKGGGGTGQALRMARHYEIPIYDLATEDGMAWALLTLSSAWSAPRG